ncbi:ser/Thr protein phosphatase family protein-like protein [Hyaloscypha variabilis F]|uniref:Ser/Thr protein phosphatase family protein-like protein n=1 Tax=Hyaloscypha variabilis (strain UAMH 11265 / GT02V1 / F) TaxID=1149755 RepID=A0A2J6RS98_HYAVF|nr:ser/Thr protein phosphatase family protein-like protein [Hyaloscypha variabilis F]
MAETIATRFMIISDTHNFQFGNAEKWQGAFRQPVPKVDVLLHAGDLTQRGGLEAYRGVLNMLSGIDAELKLVIAGNHDLSLDGYFWKQRWTCGGDDPEHIAEHDNAMEIFKGPLAKEAGVTYLEEGLNTFALKNGAKFTIYTSPYQPEFCGWAFPYERNEDRFNLQHHSAPGVTSIATNPIPDFPSVDIMMTHGPPKGILDQVIFRNEEVGCESLLRAVSRARPRLYCFGHIHEAYGAKIITWKDDKNLIGAEAIENESSQLNGYPDSSNWPISCGKETLMVNAAIMNVRYKPANSPWLVDLDLPRAT